VEEDVAYLSYSPGICLEEPRKTTKKLRLDSVLADVQTGHLS
jgi:hypothetical protein